MARIDFILIPCNWVVPTAGSWVSLDIDPGHKSVDHFPVLLELQVCERGRRVRGDRRLRFDREAMAAADGKAKLQDICRRLPLQPWSLDADTHFAVLQRQLLRELWEAFPAPKAQRAHSFLSASTWLLRDHRVWLRKHVLAFKMRVKLASAWLGLRIWRFALDWRIGVVSVCIRLHAGASAAGFFVSSLRNTRQELRRSVRKDRRDWLHQLSVQAPLVPVRDVVRQLRPLLRGKRQACRRSLQC